MVAILLAVACSTALEQLSENKLIEYACELQHNHTLREEFYDEVDSRHDSDITGQHYTRACFRRYRNSTPSPFLRSPKEIRYWILWAVRGHSPF